MKKLLSAIYKYLLEPLSPDRFLWCAICFIRNEFSRNWIITRPDFYLAFSF